MTPRSWAPSATRAIAPVTLVASLSRCAPRQVDLVDVSGKQVDAVAVLETTGSTAQVNGMDNARAQRADAARPVLDLSPNA